MTSDQEFHDAFEKYLKNKLEQCGFIKVNSEPLLAPELLYKKGNLWLGVSWDFRDQYFEVAFGQPYKYIDVLPAITIEGAYDVYLKKINKSFEKKYSHIFFKKNFQLIAETIDLITDQFQDFKEFEKSDNKIFNTRKGRKIFREHRSRVKEKITDENFADYKKEARIKELEFVKGYT